MRILIASVMMIVVAGCASTSSQLATQKSPAFNGHMAYEQARNERVARENEMIRLRQVETEALRPTNTRSSTVGQATRTP